MPTTQTPQRSGQLSLKPKPQYPTRFEAPPEEPINPKAELNRYQQLTTRDTYEVAGRGGSKRREPAARLVRRWAQMKGIKSRIIDIGKDKERAWARVAAWTGDEKNPTQYGERAVFHVFDMMMIEAIFDAMKDGMYMPTGESYESGAPKMGRQFLAEEDVEMTESGWPRIVNPIFQLQLMKNHLQKIKFAERDALGKAERAAFLLVLNYETGGEEGATESKGDQPMTLNQYRQEIRKGLMHLCDTDEAKCMEKLAELSLVEGKYPKVQKLGDIASIEHAEEILARVDALLEKETPEE